MKGEQNMICAARRWRSRATWFVCSSCFVILSDVKLNGMSLASRLPLILFGVAFCFAQTATIALNANKLKLRNVKAEPVTYKGKSALRVSDVGARTCPTERGWPLSTGRNFRTARLKWSCPAILCRDSRQLIGVHWYRVPN